MRGFTLLSLIVSMFAGGVVVMIGVIATRNLGFWKAKMDDTALSQSLTAQIAFLMRNRNRCSANFQGKLLQTNHTNAQTGASFDPTTFSVFLADAGGNRVSNLVAVGKKVGNRSITSLQLRLEGGAGNLYFATLSYTLTYSGQAGEVFASNQSFPLKFDTVATGNANEVSISGCAP